MKRREKPQTPEQKLYESCPEEIKKLQRQSAREKRITERREWKEKNRK